MSVYDDGADDHEGYVTTEVAEEKFIAGAQAMREMLARFVEHGGHVVIAESIRANWNPRWGKDPGRLDDVIPNDCWGVELPGSSRDDVRNNPSISRAVKRAMEHYWKTLDELAPVSRS